MFACVSSVTSLVLSHVTVRRYHTSEERAGEEGGDRSEKSAE